MEDKEAKGPIISADSAILSQLRALLILLPHLAAMLRIFMSLGHTCEMLVVSLAFGGHSSHLCLPIPVSCWHIHDYSFQFEPPIYLYQTPLSNGLMLPGSIAVPGQLAWHLLVRDGCRVTRCTYTAKKSSYDGLPAI